MSIIPRSNHASVYATLVTIPFAGAISWMILYEILGVDSFVVDALMISSSACGVYSSAAIILKIGRLCILRQWATARKCTRSVFLAITVNGLILVGYWATQFF